MKPHSILVPTVLSLVSASALAQAPELPAPPVQEATQEQTEARFEKMLLHLHDGRILRVRARAAGAEDLDWEIKENRGENWILPAAAVTRAALEKDVLKESRRLAKEADKKDPARRVALASWMFDQGLWDEGIDELNPILARQPDQADAVALLKRNTPPLALPELAPDAKTMTTFLRKVAGAKPVSREVAALRLGEMHGTIDVKATLRHELVQASLKRRSFAALALRRLFPGQEIKALLNRAVLDGSSDVREGAALALRAAEDPAVMLPVLKALGSSSSTVRANAAQALGHMGYPHAVQPLVSHLSAVNTLAQSSGGYTPPRANIFVGKQISYVQDYDVEVAQGAAIGDPTINTIMEGAVLDVRVLGVSQSQISSEKSAVRTALANLTGASPGRTTKAWTNWWDENGTEWLASLNPPASGPTSPGH